MNHHEKQAIAEVLESYFTPDSPEGLACAMYQLRRIYETETRRIKTGRRTTQGKRNRTHGGDIEHQPSADSMGETGSDQGRADTQCLDCRPDQKGARVISSQNATVDAPAHD